MQTAQLAQTHCQQLLALQLSGHPVLGRLKVSFAALAKVDGGLALDPRGNVDVEADTVLAHGHTRGAGDGGAACCAKDSRGDKVSSGLEKRASWVAYVARESSPVNGVNETGASISMVTDGVLVISKVRILGAALSGKGIPGRKLEKLEKLGWWLCCGEQSRGGQ